MATGASRPVAEMPAVVGPVLVTGAGAAANAGAGVALAAITGGAPTTPVVEMPIVFAGDSVTGAGPRPPGTPVALATITNWPGPLAVQRSCVPETMHGISAPVATLTTSMLSRLPLTAANSAAVGVSEKLIGAVLVAGAVSVISVLTGRRLPSGTVTLGDDGIVLTVTPGLETMTLASAGVGCAAGTIVGAPAAGPVAGVIIAGDAIGATVAAAGEAVTAGRRVGVALAGTMLADGATLTDGATVADALTTTPAVGTGLLPTVSGRAVAEPTAVAGNVPTAVGLTAGNVAVSAGCA